LNAFRSHRHRRLAVLPRHSWLALAQFSRSYTKEVCRPLPPYSLRFFCGLRRLKRLPSCHSTIKFKWVISQLEASHWMTNGPSHHFFSWVLTHAFEGLPNTRNSQEECLCTFLPPSPFVNISGQPTHHPITRIVLTLSYRFDAAPIEIDLPGIPRLERSRLCTYTSLFISNSDNDLVVYALFTIAQILRTLKHPI